MIAAVVGLALTLAASTPAPSLYQQQHQQEEIANCLAKHGANYPDHYCDTPTPLAVATLAPATNTPAPTSTSLISSASDESVPTASSMPEPVCWATGPVYDDAGHQQFDDDGNPITDVIYHLDGTPISCEEWQAYLDWLAAITPEPTPLPTGTPRPAPTPQPTTAPRAPAPVQPQILYVYVSPPTSEPTNIPEPTATATPIPTRTATSTMLETHTPVPTATRTATTVPTQQPTTTPTAAPTPKPKRVVAQEQGWNIHLPPWPPLPPSPESYWVALPPAEQPQVDVEATA